MTDTPIAEWVAPILNLGTVFFKDEKQTNQSWQTKYSCRKKKKIVGGGARKKGSYKIHSHHWREAIYYLAVTMWGSLQILFLTHTNNTFKQNFRPYFTDEKFKFRDQIICPRSHSQHVAEPRICSPSVSCQALLLPWCQTHISTDKHSCWASAVCTHATKNYKRNRRHCFCPPRS